MSSIKSLFSPDNKTKKTSSKTSPSLFYGLISTVKTLLSPTGNGSNHHDMHNNDYMDDVKDDDVYNNDYMDDVKDDDVYNNDNVEQNIADNSEKSASSSSSSSSSSDADEESKSKGTISIITRNNHYHN